MTTTSDVLIASAGPTGLTLACELARRGVSFRLIDRSDRFLGGSRADGIQPRTLEVFADLGVIDQVLAGGDLDMVLRAYRGDEVVWEGRMTQPAEPTPAGRTPTRGSCPSTAPSRSSASTSPGSAGAWSGRPRSPISPSTRTA